MDKNGLFLRNNVTAIQQVQLLYGTPRNYIYYMNRPSDDKRLEEQNEDKITAPPITMELIEQGVSLASYDAMLRHERGRSDYRRISDIQLCEEIDRIVIQQFMVPL